MKVLAVRKSGIFAMYLICFIVGIIITICGIMAQINGGDGIPLAIVGIVLFISCLILVIDIAKTPKNIIMYNNDSYTINALGKKINLKDIIDVSYKKARAKHIYYKWGTVIITTNSKKLKCKYVAECEDVAKQVYALSIKAKEMDL